MTISYNWISEYIPVPVSHERINEILTAIGLEVESMERYESIPGGLEGLVVGEVLECIPHPGADKLKLTKVGIGNGAPLRIVCGAPNVSAGQKVVVATIGTTIHPVKGDAMTMKAARIRGEDSFGMICAEDEIGVGTSHEGIIILPQDLEPGSPLAGYYKVYKDWTYEIGLTPNRMDAMSHFGVARDVCAYLSHHDGRTIVVKNTMQVSFPDTKGLSPYPVEIQDTKSCRRFSGILIKNISVGESPHWLQEKLRSIGLRAINNIVDITNFILHDTGQPLHAYDADKIGGQKIIVKELAEGTPFITLDEKERKLGAEDLIICDGDEKGMCIAGVFGGYFSGVSASTKNIFLESAWFDPVSIRKTSFRLGLRTDAAAHFEKIVDIGNTANVLKKAAMLITDIAGGDISSALTDVYPSPEAIAEVTLKYSFLKKLSGKAYSSATVKTILISLGFDIKSETEEALTVIVPFSKPDISLPADLVEEVMRIDGLDNVIIPKSITLSPSTGARNITEIRMEKISGYLVGAGFHEIFTNSITNSAYFAEAELSGSVRLLNNLSAGHNIMRPSMLETGLESLAFNLNRKNSDLLFFEFGKTYNSPAVGKYNETGHLCLYATGNYQPASWKDKAAAADVYRLKGIVEAIAGLCGLTAPVWRQSESIKLSAGLTLFSGKTIIAETGVVSKKMLSDFDIRQPVFFADIFWSNLQEAATPVVAFRKLPNQLPVYRDLAMIVPASLPFGDVESVIRKIRLARLIDIRLFDLFESEKLGAGRKSLAVSLTFLDDEKTLTDREIDGMINKIILTLEQDLGAEIRKGLSENSL
jgi:phenylalanyl-tRNA synthetase beta chain